jgi:CheY-like chemotaxis protein
VANELILIVEDNDKNRKLVRDVLQLAEGYVQVASRGPVAVKGLPDPVEVYALTGASAADPPSRRSRAGIDAVCRPRR